MTEPFATLPEALQFRGERQADRPALHLHDGQKFAAQSWGNVVRDVLLTAAALDELGVRPGDRVATVSENRVEWIHVDLACAAIGAVHAALHSVLGPSALAEQIADCRPRAIVVSTQEIAARLGSVVDAAPADAVWLGLDDAFAVGHKKAIVLREMVRSASIDRGRKLLAESVRRTRPSDLSALIYTSGTTGDSKGVMLSHDNLVSNAVATATAYGHDETDLRLCWLPLSHVFARTCDFYAWLLIGGELALCRGRDFVLEDCRSIRPTQIAGVPYFYEKAAHGLRDAGLADQPGALAAVFGGRIRRLGSGGAALPDHIADFYEQRGVPLLQGYGLTESSPVISASSIAATRRGAVGRPIPGVEVRIADDGEILTRGRHVMLGYYGKPEETAQTIRDGWLHTGDLGRLDEDGYLWITGRKKELIVTALGKNIAPNLLESLLTDDPLIAQAMVIGDDRKYLAAIIVPEPEALSQLAEHQGLSNSMAKLLDDPRIQAEYRRRIDAQLAGLGKSEQVGRFELVAEPFTVATGELTPKLSLAREVVQKRRAEVVARLYAAEHPEKRPT